jgi:asparagine N-glycosylation enzyme membrane subunit Stt3
MKLVPDAKDILKRAWSVRLQAAQIVIFGVTLGLFTIWPSLSEVLPTKVFVIGAVVLGMLTIFARVIKQPGMDDE